MMKNPILRPIPPATCDDPLNRDSLVQQSSEDSETSHVDERSGVGDSLPFTAAGADAVDLPAPPPTTSNGSGEDPQNLGDGGFLADAVARLLRHELERCFFALAQRFPDETLLVLPPTLRLVPADAGRKCRRPRGCEIVLRANEDLYRGPQQVLTILLHRMVHMANGLADQRDASHSGYHNQRFRDLALAVGFDIGPRHPRFGLGMTEPGPELRRFFDTLNPQGPIFQRRGDPSPLLWSCGVTPFPLREATAHGGTGSAPEGCLTVVPRPSQWCAPRRCGVALEIPTFDTGSFDTETLDTETLDSETADTETFGSTPQRDPAHRNDGAPRTEQGAPLQNSESSGPAKTEEIPASDVYAPLASDPIEAGESPLLYRSASMPSGPRHRTGVPDLRQLRVKGLWHPDHPVPLLRLSGNWLDEAGFAIGEAIAVDVQMGRLVIRRRGQDPCR